MRSPSLPVLLFGAGAILVGTGVIIAVTGEPFDTKSTSETVTVASAPAPETIAPLPPLAPGNYLFDVLGSGPQPVSVESTGPESITMIRPANEANPDEFRVTLNRQDNIYTGEISNPTGVVCKSDGQAHPAQTRYTVKADGTDGTVEVLGEPCGPGVPNIPLKFDLVPA